MNLTEKQIDEIIDKYADDADGEVSEDGFYTSYTSREAMFNMIREAIELNEAQK